MGPSGEDHVSHLLDLRDRYCSDQVRATVLKIYLDGVQELHTAYLLAPYADRPETVGIPNLPPEVFQDLVVAADAAGIDVHVHAIGEGATRLVLDAVEAARRANPPWDRRHTSCHVYYVHPDDLPRFAELGVIAQTSGEWILRDEFHELMERRIGRERTDHLYRLNTLVKSGATVTLGSDWPASCNISTYEPLVQIEMAHTRRPPGEPDAPLLAPSDECLSLSDAIAAMTINAARQIKLDGMIGSLVPGKRADLVILERNLFDVEPHEIHRTPVRLTMMDGRVTYQDPSWDG
jgi:predicted amidohydrolase YtcJ